MVAPMAAAAAIGGMASALETLGNLFANKKDRKAKKKLSKEELKFKREELAEQKRRTNAELYNSSAEREHKSALKGREERNLLRSRQAQALEEMASGFRSSYQVAKKKST